MVPNPPAAGCSADDTDPWCLPFAVEQVTADAGVTPSPESTFRAIVEQDSDAVRIMDAKFGMVSANPVARAMFALPDHLKSWVLPDGIERVHADDLPQIETTFLTRGHVTTDARFRMPDGEWRWFTIYTRELAIQEQVEALEREREQECVPLHDQP